MDFFNKTKDSLLSAGTKFSQKANDVSGALAINVKIHEKEKLLQNYIAELGKVMLEQHTEETQRLCPELVYNIQELAKQIETDKKELAICKGLKICQNCGAEQQPDVMYCTVCGMNMEESANIIARNKSI